MTVLVTGATGFIGAWIVRALLESGEAVRATVRPDSDHFRLADVDDHIDWVTADVFDPAVDLAPACRGVDLCIHAAWYAVPGKYLEAPENLACVQGTLRLLETLASASCLRAVCVGTCFEYDFDYGWLSETTPSRPRSLYAAAKSATRMMAEQTTRAHGTELCWVRPFYQYGPYEDSRRLVPYVLETLAKGDPANVTRGLQVRDFLHVADVGSAIVAAARSTLTGPVNIGSGRPVTVRDIVATLAHILERSHLVHFGARPDNPTDPPFICANIAKLVDGTGWSARYDLESGLRDTVARWQRRPAAIA